MPATAAAAATSVRRDTAAQGTQPPARRLRCDGRLASARRSVLPSTAQNTSSSSARRAAHLSNIGAPACRWSRSRLPAIHTHLAGLHRSRIPPSPAAGHRAKGISPRNCLDSSNTFDPLPRTFDPLPRRFDPLPRTFDPLSRTFDPLPRRFDPLPRRFDPLPRRFDPLPRRFDPLPRRFDPLPRRFLMVMAIQAGAGWRVRSRER